MSDIVAFVLGVLVGFCCLKTYHNFKYANRKGKASKQAQIDLGEMS